MKHKVIIFFMILIMFTGCNKSKLTCEKKEKNPGYIYSEKYELVYNKKGENLKQINITMRSDYNDRYTSEEIEKEFDDVVEYCNFYESASNKLIECVPKLKGDVINIKIKIKVANISDELFTDMMYVTKEEINKLKETKKTLENVGYTCK